MTLPRSNNPTLVMARNILNNKEEFLLSITKRGIPKDPAIRQMEGLQEVYSSYNRTASAYAAIKSKEKACRESKTALPEDHQSKKNSMEATIMKLMEELRIRVCEFPNLISLEIADLKTDKVLYQSKEKLPKRRLPTYWEYGVSKGWFSQMVPTKWLGSNWSGYLGDGAKLHRALVNYLLDSVPGHFEVSFPAVVPTELIEKTGRTGETFSLTTEERLSLSPTAEYQLCGFVSGEQIDPERHPTKLMAYSECFRDEHIPYGKESSHILRTHQFGKVELFWIMSAEESEQGLEEMVEIITKVLEPLGVDYRCVDQCPENLNRKSMRTRDIDIWAPGSELWLEVSSVSNTGSIQSIPLDVQLKRDNKLETPHLLNGSCFGIPRLFAGVVESNIKKGEFSPPKVLRPYLKDWGGEN